MSADEECGDVAAVAGVLDELDILSQVDRMSVVEPSSVRSAKVGVVLQKPLLDCGPICGVVDVTHAIHVGRAERPPDPLAVNRRRERELRRRDAPLRGFRVVVEAHADPGGARVRPEVNPRAVDLDRPAGIAGERPAPTGRERRDAAAPRHDVDEVVGEERCEHVDPHGAEDPQVVGGAPVRLEDVVDRSVLEIARDGVESEPAGRVRVGEPHAIADPKDPARGRLWHEGLHAARPHASCSTILPSSSPGSSST